MPFTRSLPNLGRVLIDSLYFCVQQKKTKKEEKEKKMGDDGEDYAIESVDAGASATIPMEAGQIKKGG